MSTIDTVIAIRVVQLLATPFKDWPAFHKGIIDQNGKQLTPANKLTQAQSDDWTMLHRLCWRLKLILAKIPGGSSQVASIAAAYLLVKENLENGTDIKENFEGLIKSMKSVTEKELSLVEEVMAGGSTSTTTNTVATAMPQTKDLPQILNKKKMIRRFKDYRKEATNGNS